MQKEFMIGGRFIGAGHFPLVIAEIGINHGGDFDKAVRMVNDAHAVGCECVKFQCHVVDDEMAPSAKNVMPVNAEESIWAIMERCALNREQDKRLKDLAESKGMLYLSTPFSRAAADQLESMGVVGYKIGSGECNNYPLVKHIANFGKPVIMSTGMNNLESITRSVAILEDARVPYALMHCTSMYPTPYNKVRLGALALLKEHFGEVPLGLSDHSIGNYTCFGAVALGAAMVEKHFTSDMSWPGPDMPISIDSEGLGELIKGVNAIFEARGGGKDILAEEAPTIAFAYACVVAIRDINKGDVFSMENIWVKRPGTGPIKAIDFEKILGKKASQSIKKGQQIDWSDFES